MEHSVGAARNLPPVLSGVCGLAMAAAAGFGTSGIAAAGALLTVGAVLAGLWWRPAATAAVALAVAVLGFADPPTVSAVVAGLAAVGYLALRHAGTMTPATVIGALGFTVAGLAATAFPLSLPWLPLLAPFAVLGVYILVAQPFLDAER
jgi:hypothetical protein